jgi:transketolase
LDTVVKNPKVILIAAGSEVELAMGTRNLLSAQGVTAGWWRYVGRDGAAVGTDRFGESGPGSVVLKHFGFSADAVAQTALKVIGSHTGN